MNAPNSNSNYTSPSIQAPTASASANMRLAKDYEPIMSSFRTVNVSNPSNQRPHSGTDMSESSGPQFSPTSGSMSSQPPGSTSTYHNIPMTTNMSSNFLLAQSSTLGPAFEHSPYETLASSNYPSSGPSDGVPLLTLQVPDHAFPPSLAHTNSPPYNSDSNWSTPSDASRQGTAWPRDRAGWATPADALAAAQQQPQFMQNVHMLRQQASLDIVPDHFKSSYAPQTRHYDTSIGLCQPVDEQGGVEGGSDMVSRVPEYSPTVRTLLDW
jgi:hypothetical protein